MNMICGAVGAVALVTRDLGQHRTTEGVDPCVVYNENRKMIDI